MATQTKHSEAVEKLGDMIKDIDMAMFTTVEEDGTLHSRPMSTQKTEFDGNLWFFTALDTPKVEEIHHDKNVSLSYAEPGKNRYVAVSGKAQVVRDRQKIEELWSPILKAWFPKGKDDPQLALLKVEVESAEYWDSPSSKIVEIVGFVKALAIGKSYEGGENKKLDL
jgi:general stress protein 26